MYFENTEDIFDWLLYVSEVAKEPIMSVFLNGPTNDECYPVQNSVIK